MSEETRKQQEEVACYRRKKALANRGGGSFFDNSSDGASDSFIPTDVAPASRVKAAPTVGQTTTAVAEPIRVRQLVDRRAAPQTAAADTIAKRSGPLRIELPSKKVLSDSAPSFTAPVQWRQKFFPQGVDVYVARRGGNVVQGVFALNKSKPHGASATLHDNGRLKTIAFYSEGRLNGPVRTWTDEKQRLLYAEYRNGDKQGLVCLYRQEKPWLVQEWDRAKLQREYLVSCDSESPAVLSSVDIQGNRAELADALGQLNDLEEEMRLEHSRIRSEISRWASREDRRVKQRRLTQHGAGHRSPAEATDAMRARELEGQWQAALDRSTD